MSDLFICTHLPSALYFNLDNLFLMYILIGTPDKGFYVYFSNLLLRS
jgi:hypothetical protein